MFSQASGGYKDWIDEFAKPVFEDLLSDLDFYKIHQSHIVNLSFIKKILREDGGYALMNDGAKVPYGTHVYQST